MIEPPSELITTEMIGRVLLIAMQRPHKRNAVDRVLADALSAALDRLDDDPDLWAGVLTGTPDVFSPGSDLTSGGDYVTERGGAYGIIRRTRRRPLIAAVEGMALGGEMEIVLACDLVVAAATASFGLPEVARGLVPTCGGLFRSLVAMPRNLAHELVLTGLPIDATRAHAAGLVNRLSEPGRSVEVAIELAEQVASNGPTAVSLSMQAMREVDDATEAVGWPATDRAPLASRPPRTFAKAWRRSSRSGPRSGPVAEPARVGRCRRGPGHPWSGAVEPCENVVREIGQVP